MIHCKEALDFATTKEQEAEEFYRTWSTQASGPVGQKLFSELAETERGHAEKLSRISLKDLITQGSSLSDLRLSDYLVEVEPQFGMSLEDALILTIKREQASAALWTAQPIGRRRAVAVCRLGAGGMPSQASP